MTYRVLSGQAAADRFEDIGPHTAIVINTLRAQLPASCIECEPSITVHTDPDQKVTYLATVLIAYDEDEDEDEYTDEELYAMAHDNQSYPTQFLHWMASKF